MNKLLMSVKIVLVASLKGTLITLEIFDLVMHTFYMPQQVDLFRSCIATLLTFVAALLARLFH